MVLDPVVLEPMLDKFFYISILKHECVSEIIEFSRQNEDFFQLIDLESIVSEIQVEATLERAKRRMENGSRIRGFGPLVLMYLSGQPQVGKAIRAAGISVRTNRAMLLCHDRHDMDRFLERFQGAVSEILQSPLPHDDPARDREVFFAMSYVDFQS